MIENENVVSRRQSYCCLYVLVYYVVYIRVYFVLFFRPPLCVSVGWFHPLGCFSLLLAYAIPSAASGLFFPLSPAVVCTCLCACVFFEGAGIKNRNHAHHV